jgi:hypothetical protein
VTGPRDDAIDIQAATDGGANQDFSGISGGAQVGLHIAEMGLHQRLDGGVDRGR